MQNGSLVGISDFLRYALIMSTNAQLAALFQEMADIMQILGVDVFKVKAFEKVARSLEQYPVDVASIGPDVKKLQEIEGVGKGSATRIAEFLQTGKITDHDDLLAQFPPTLAPLLRVQGLGPKTVALLWKECGITSMEELKRKLDTDETALCEIKGMGLKKVESLRKNLEFAQTTQSRIRIGQALPLARWFLEQLRQMKEVKSASHAGSLRRGRETIGDIDLLVAADTENARSISDRFIKLEPVAEVLAKGETKTSIRTKRDSGDGVQVDLRIVTPDVFGAALMYFTGSKDHNIALRERAIKQEMKLSEWGLFDTRGSKEKLIAGRTEEEVYQHLGLSWIPPELREDQGEIAQAANGLLPKLIEMRDIVAELHAHTTASDGSWSIRELAEAAIDRGFHTIAVTDHSRSQHIANGLSAERLEQHIQDVREVAAALKRKIRVLAGSEVDILVDGTLDYPNSLLKELDIVVASPHAGLTQEPAKATRRLIKAINNPYVTILGHPTGRLVNKREGIKPDIKELVTAAAQRGVALEINANHYRLDLRDTHARLALEAGAKLSINTDAHGPSDLDELPYGVLTARRAGATAGQVVNCMSKDELTQWLAGTRK